MSTRRPVLHDWTRHGQTLLPTVHAARTESLAVLALGVLWGGTVTLRNVATVLPLEATDASIERRWHRFLANDRVALPTRWRPLLPSLLAGVGQRDLLFVFDPTPDRDCATLLCLGVV